MWYNEKNIYRGENMPFVTIQFLEGRNDEQKKALVSEVTEVVSKNLQAPKENIHVILQEMKKTDYGVGGVRKSDI
ncbi:4-oxalocrotonate tautomerase [Listeria sp. FSL L7-1485]|uniref:Tautomerase n=2 Tax=Listeria immobilis TaxID=2713502 RepID=A0A7X0XA80_9LIST|nr:4-oxalocrotonate tautomerase [Listeria immobilis]MBC1490001.1 4-oxalocrotonate tautomerase [Listeria immobilis]MBC1508139.1 4-oxalocrotonate tautomerase [Listeria immobilis]MBC1511104.1 4-oxalocrotonate tautomerase [Listeria immobilis]MBC1516922.1 4-oxalocrotonate tautomerase [Listeria immobilis]